MKKIICATIFILFSSITIASAEESTQEEENFNREVYTIANDGQIKDAIWTRPLIIDAQNYGVDKKTIIRLQENVIYRPPLKYLYPAAYNNHPAAIIIAKNDVTIDLAGFTLCLDPVSAPNIMQKKPTYGISILPGVKNVKIVSATPSHDKGCIFGFSGYAIYASGTAQSYSNFDMHSNMIKNIIIHNLLLSQNINGIYIENALQATVTDTNIIYNYSPRPVYGLYYSNVLSGCIESCKINQNFSYSDTYGILLEDTIGVEIKKTITSFNKSLKDGDAIGICITGSIDTTSYANIVSDCQADSNMCSFTNEAKSVGFMIHTASHHNSIEKCSSSGNTHSPLFSGNTIPTIYPQGIGFLIDRANLNKIHENRSGYNDTYGFYDTAVVSTSLFTSNFAILNLVANFYVTISSISGSEQLPTIAVSQSNLNNDLASGPPLANIEVISA
jgi:hypothetical protein